MAADGAGAIVSFEFATAARIVFGDDRIVFGDDRIGEVGRIAADFGRRVFVVVGGNALRAAGVLDRVAGYLDESGCASTVFAIFGEPTISAVDAGVEAARAWEPDCVLAIGGGSVLDAGKAIAGLATNAGSVRDYLEGVGTARVERPALPLIAAPTTAGTGSEVTKNAVITDDARTFKRSMRSDRLLPRVALVDPVLMRTMPPAVTASSGLDALAQLIEAYTSNRASPVTDALAEEGIRRAARSLERAYRDGEDPDARRDMALAALLGGICLANAGLGAVHGLASPLGAFFPAPHGAVCAILLPPVVAKNVRRLRVEERRSSKRPDAAAALAKYRRIADIFDVRGREPLGALVARLETLVRALAVPGLAEWGIGEADIPRIVAGSRGSSMRYNPVLLTDDELAGILREAM